MAKASGKTKQPPREGSEPREPRDPQAPVVPAPASPARLSRRGRWVLAAVLVLVNLPLLHRLLRGAPDVTVTLPYTNDFSRRDTLAQDFWSLGGGLWVVEEGQLYSPAVRGNPLWLQARLPQDVVVEFDVRAADAGGEAQLTLFGDGRDSSLRNTGQAQTSGYLLTQGVRGGATARLAKRDELAWPLADLQRRGTLREDSAFLVEASAPSVPMDRSSHWRVERRGARLRWFIDGERVLEVEDPYPLQGRGHDRLGLSSRDTPLFFDNLSVRPLAAGEDFVARPQAPLAPPAPFSDAFDAPALGEAWRPTAPAAVQVSDGALVVENLHNRPVWLSRPLAQDAVIELDAWTDDPRGDIKLEAWGDGRSAYAGDLTRQYTATGYVFIFGGWKNSASVIARGNEHAAGNAVREGAAVQPGKRYHFRITRQGGRFTWEVDGKPFLSYEDAQPLYGPRNQYLGLSGWETRVHFDNVSVRPL
ncbi:hypothetical protein FGE12_21030 [Aggregicoccus sp. 17bor-14]|uniref:hypothetical protein n=1 Tax=Myxococcaceae TaxID=31 RepID=UPI00129C6290|nr:MULTISPECIES: hypothetical protein [Myxococcaceae]MBF5044897.1 hypothetical protein [Simulacricoccus sp. 17bor-14]MRI90641.1 hypothetical protein [Aggregicoccus sp. 17bor-14]